MLMEERDGDLDSGLKLYFFNLFVFSRCPFLSLKMHIMVFLTYIVYALVLMYFCTALLLP